MAVYRLGERVPSIATSAFIAPNATTIGGVSIAENASVWFGAILRGDLESIEIGANSNVQDGVVMHTDPGYPLRVGAFVTIGHQAVLHGCIVGDGTVIGIGAIVLTGAVIGKSCLVGAGAVVTENKVFPDRVLILGVPAKVVRELTNDEVGSLLETAHHYVLRGPHYRTTLRCVEIPLDPHDL